MAFAAQPLGQLKETASQTAGPYVHIGLTPNFCGIGGVYPGDLGMAMVNAETKGERITVRGRCIDGAGQPLRDCLIEIWQADAAGLYQSPTETRGAADPNFTGWGRQPADGTTGEWVVRNHQAGQGAVTPTAACRRRTSASGSSPAASTSASTRGCIFPTRPRPTRPTRC